MTFLAEIMPSILYVLGAILMILFIVLVFKLILTLDKVDRVVEDISSKSRKLNGLFDMIDKIQFINDKIISGILSVVMKVFKKRKGDEENE